MLYRTYEYDEETGVESDPIVMVELWVLWAVAACTSLLGLLLGVVLAP